jgi:hypothetical protein
VGQQAKQFDLCTLVPALKMTDWCFQQTMEVCIIGLTGNWTKQFKGQV